MSRKIYFDPIDCPEKIHIKSNKLALNHLCYTDASSDPLSSLNCFVLNRLKFIDSVLFWIDYDHDMTFGTINPDTEQVEGITGWINPSDFDYSELKLPDSHNPKITRKEPKWWEVTTIYVKRQVHPSLIRIKSECLCLDHTFENRFEGGISIDDCYSLKESGFFDSIQIFLREDEGVFVNGDPSTEEQLPVEGWLDISYFELDKA